MYWKKQNDRPCCSLFGQPIFILYALEKLSNAIASKRLSCVNLYGITDECNQLTTLLMELLDYQVDGNELAASVSISS